MTTLVVSLPVALAKRVARAADALGLSHDEFGRLAVRLFLKAEGQTPPATFGPFARGVAS